MKRALISDDAFLDRLIKAREQEVQFLRLMRAKSVAERPDRFQIHATLIWLSGDQPEATIGRLRALRARARASHSVHGEISCLVRLWPLVANYFGWEAAIREVRALSKLSPDAEYLRTLGFVLENSGRLDQARDAYKHAVTARGADANLREQILGDIERLKKKGKRPRPS